MRAIDARPLAATSAALTTGGARAAACWSSSSAAMRLIGAIGWLPRCLGELCGSDEALCLDAQLLTLEQITRSSPVESAEPWYAAMRVHCPSPFCSNGIR